MNPAFNGFLRYAEALRDFLQGKTFHVFQPDGQPLFRGQGIYRGQRLLILQAPRHQVGNVFPIGKGKIVHVLQNNPVLRR